MSNLPCFIFEEHSKQANDKEIVLSKVICNDLSKYNFSPDNLNYLGLSEKFISHYFIGMRWIEWKVIDSIQKGIIWVKPKHYDIPYEQLLWKCLSHPVVCNHLDECYKIYPDEPAIPLNDQVTDFITPLLITDFLVRVQKIAKRGLKKGFVNVNEILNNKIKGKILVNQTIKHQLKRNTITQTYCSYQIHTVNCIENKILKTALVQAQKYVNLHKIGKNIKKAFIEDILLYNLNAFLEVDVESIKLSDFNIINNSAFYKEYKPALNLAKLILKGLGFSIYSDISAKIRTVPPFHINMPELFERYCEVLLRERYEDVNAGYQQYGYSETRSGKKKLRPDFIIRSMKMIIDCKYKYWISGKDDDDGLMQLSLYSRRKDMRDFYHSDQIPILQFLYPKNGGELTIDFEKGVNEKIDGFLEIYKYPVSLNFLKGV